MNLAWLVASMAAGMLSAAGSVAAADSLPVASKGPTPLDGTTWVLSALGSQALPPGAAPTARFEAGRLSGTDGCNRYSVPYTIRGTAITIGERAAMTQMACEPDVMRQAKAFMAALSGAKTFRLNAGALQLLGANSGVLASFAAQSQSLAGSSWKATGINNGRQAVVSLAADTSVTMDFAEGKVSGLAGCNQYSASFTAQGKSLRFTPAAATRKMCAPGVMEQEQAFFRALETVATMQIEGKRLELRTADAALALTLARSAP